MQDVRPIQAVTPMQIISPISAIMPIQRISSIQAITQLQAITPIQIITPIETITTLEPTPFVPGPPGFGFTPFVPGPSIPIIPPFGGGLDFDTGLGPARRGGRRYARTPSVVAVELGIYAPSPVAGEITGIISRPLISRKRRKRR